MSQNSMRFHKQIKEVIPLLIICILLISVVVWGSDSASAANKTSGDYIYTVKKNTVTIVQYIGKKKKVVIPSEVKGMKVVEIGEEAFANNKKITKVTIPDSVLCIREKAFYYCLKLEEVILPDVISEMGDSTFCGCVKLRKVDMPSSMIEMPKYAFGCCSQLSEIILPNDMKIIREGALFQAALTSIIFPTGVQEIGAYAFRDCIYLNEIILPEGLIKLENTIFIGCTQLKSIYLPESIKEIGKKAFEGCVNLTSIDLPDELTTIKEDAFKKCTKLESVTLPSKLIYITDDINYLPKIQDLTSYNWNYNMGGGSTSYHPFAKCTSLKEIIISGDNSMYTTENGVLYDKDKTVVLCYPPAKEGTYTLPETVKAIMPYAFANVSVLTELNLTDNVTNIGAYAFFRAASLKSVNLTENVQVIQSNAFSRSGIDHIKIPDSILELNETVFRNCASLKTLEIPAGLEMPIVGDFQGPLDGCISLERVTVAKGNEFFKDVDGVLYEKVEGSKWYTLICYPAKKKGKTYKVPKFASLGSNSFNQCKYLRKLIIPEGITSLYNPFFGCSNLKVQVPKSVKYFPSKAHYTDYPVFTNCKNSVLLVHKNSLMHKQCIKQKIPFKVIK